MPSWLIVEADTDGDHAWALAEHNYTPVSAHAFKAHATCHRGRHGEKWARRESVRAT
jgi:hypothetical protein